MRVKIIQDMHCACFRGPHKVKAGQVVETMVAYNQPDYEKEGKLFVAEPDCPGDCYGIMLESDDYEATQ